MSTATRARSHYRRQQQVALAGVRAVRSAVRGARSYADAKAAAATGVATYQLASALNASTTLAREAGRSRIAVPTAFVGTTQLGWPIETPLNTILDRVERDARDLELEIAQTTEAMLASLDLFVQSEVIAAGADAASVEIVAEPDWQNYVRVLVLPSCTRCVALAGRIYRDLEGFARHPNCDCEHWPVQDYDRAIAEGLVTDPMVAFERGQVRGLSKADEQAIRDGADLVAVVNATRGGGRRPQGMTNAITAEIFGRTVKATLEGTTRRGEWRRDHPDLPIRLRPESIYAHARDREDALRLLRLYGYMPPVRDSDREDSRRETVSMRGVDTPTPADQPDAPDPAAGALGGAARGASGGDNGSGPPVVRATPSGDDGDRDRRERQAALAAEHGIDFGDERLEPHELDFLERFTAAGERLAWIPRDRAGRRPTNDLVWLSNGGIEVEVKSTTARYKPIQRHISDAVTRAARQGVVKTNFIVDIGDRPLTTVLRRQLEQYNRRQTTHRIDRLWVMTFGELVEIQLLT